MLLVRADSKDADKLISGLVEDQQGEIVSSEDLGVKNLAYKIKGEPSAKFLKLVVNVPAVNTSKLEYNIVLKQDILRHMIVATNDKLEAKKGLALVDKKVRDEKKGAFEAERAASKKEAEPKVKPTDAKDTVADEKEGK